MRKHVVKCTGLSFRHKHEIQSLSNIVEGNYHKIASEEAIIVASKMKNKTVHDEIRYDHSIMVWLNAEVRRRETAKHQYEKIRFNLIRLGRLKIEMKKLQCSIKQLSDIFDENYYDDFISATKILGKVDQNTKYLQAPATACDVGLLVKDVAKVYYTELSPKKSNDKLRTKITNFLLKHEVMWKRVIGNTIAES